MYDYNTQRADHSEQDLQTKMLVRVLGAKTCWLTDGPNLL
jgi:hypothetical protein